MGRFRTKTNHELNEWTENVFYPALYKMIDRKESYHNIGDWVIMCEQYNHVTHNRRKLDTLRVLHTEYILRVFRACDINLVTKKVTGWAVETASFTDRDLAIQKFTELKNELEVSAF